MRTQCSLNSSTLCEKSKEQEKCAEYGTICAKKQGWGRWEGENTHICTYILWKDTKNFKQRLPLRWEARDGEGGDFTAYSSEPLEF